MPPSYPDVNGVRTSYCSIELGAAGFQFIKGVKSINYKDVGEIPEIMGAAAVPIGRTRGSNKGEGDIEIYQEEWDDLLPVLCAGGAMGYMESGPWPITITYAEPSQLQKTKTDTLFGVRFHSAERSNSEGTDALTVKLQLSIMRIMWHSRFVAMRFIR